MRKICVVTGTRAEYGLLRGLMHLIQASERTQLQVIATNMHLSERYGNTYQEIERDGFTIDAKVPIISEDGMTSEAGETLHSVSAAVSGIGKALEQLSPDMIVLLGDRYELLAAATAALILRIPVAHLHGGETTEGAYDEAIRHSVTKMSHLHFTSTEAYRQRVIQLGEAPERVFYVGAPGVENTHQLPLLTQEALQESLGLKVDKNTIIVTYHPVTLADSAKEDIGALLKVLGEQQGKTFIFTMPNSDNGNGQIAAAILQFVEENKERARAFTSLGVQRYLSALSQCGAVVGNSSSGILEAPSFHIPTLDIGPRQQGRIAAESVFHCSTSEEEIRKGMHHILSDRFAETAKTATNPYDKPGTAQAIFDITSNYPLEGLIQKHFHDL